MARNLWFDSPCGTARRRVTQYHDVAHELAGWWAAAAATLFTAVTLFGVAVAQILACATSMYAIHPHLSKRTWALIWGVPMGLFAAVPGYRSARLLSALALVGTTFTAWFVVAAAADAARDAPPTGLPPMKWWPAEPRGLFVGGSVIGGALGTHAIFFEIVESLATPARFGSAFLVGQAWVWTLVLPHSLAANAVWGSGLAKSDSVYALLPRSPALAASVWLMNLHQVLVYGLVLMPLSYYAERLARVHTRALPLRLLARAPVVAAVLIVALAIPLYGALNALMSAAGVPALSFVLPCLIFNVAFAAPDARDAAAHPPSTVLGWTGLSPAAAWRVAGWFNWILVAFWAVAGMGAGIYYSGAAIVASARTWGVFADCFQCGVPSAG